MTKQQAAVAWFATALLASPALAQTTSAEGKTETAVETAESGVPDSSLAPPEGAAPAAAAPAEAASAAAAPAEGTSGAAAVVDPAREQAFNIKLRDIEERVNDLKERIFQSKARLIQLQEVVLHGAITGAKAVLIHRNEMGSSFALRRVQYSLDGAPIFNRVDSTGDLDAQEEVEVFNGSIAPGNHQISVYLEYQGHGYGIFSYLKGYKFKIKSSWTFSAEEGKLTTIRIVGYEKGGLTAELKDRPAVRYDTDTTRALRPDSPEAGGASPPTAARGE